MDKLNELTKEQKEENKLLISKIIDKQKFAEARNRFSNTDFLDMAQKQEVENFLNSKNGIPFKFFGGYDEAERTMLVFLPEDVELSNVYNQIISVIRIELPKELCGTYEHKTYLGALMKLGLKREKVGDIIVREDGADIIISKDIEKFILTNLGTLKRFQKSKVEAHRIEELKYVAPAKQTIKINVPSMRLDCIVGEVARCSRSEASRILEAERVFVNFKEEMRGTRTIKEEDYITIRGKGRFKITKILGTTKSGRYAVEVEK